MIEIVVGMNEKSMKLLFVISVGAGVVDAGAASRYGSCFATLLFQHLIMKQ
jgi:hypothetical protein